MHVGDKEPSCVRVLEREFDFAMEATRYFVVVTSAITGCCNADDGTLIIGFYDFLEKYCRVNA